MTTETETSPTQSRVPVVTTELEFDTVRLDLRIDRVYPAIGWALLDGVRVGHVSFGVDHRTYWTAAAAEMDKRVENGSATLEYDTPYGLFVSTDVPEYAREFCRARDPFVRHRTTLLPVLSRVDERRKRVEEWAVENTQPRIMMKALVESHGKVSTTADTLTGRKRHIGQIWWAFVLSNLAAAQHDPWLEHHDIWPAIERNIRLDAHEFVRRASTNVWNNVAGYFEAYSRIYQAHEDYLTAEPIHVRLVEETPPVYVTLASGAADARRIVYGGGD